MRANIIAARQWVVKLIAWDMYRIADEMLIIITACHKNFVCFNSSKKKKQAQTQQTTLSIRKIY